jgi:CHAD domain-containing protein
VAAYLCAQIDVLQARESGARLDCPGAVHRMRVASSRLRCSPAALGLPFQGSQAQHLRDDLLGLGAMLGPVRDVDVMRDHLHGTVAPLPVDADLVDALASLDRGLAERHSRGHGGLIEAMHSPRHLELRAALTAFVTDPPWPAKVSKRHTCRGWWDAHVPASTARPKRRNAFSVLAVRSSTRSARRPCGPGMTPGELASSPAYTLGWRDEELQEVLGRYQDSLMARGLLRDLADRMPERQAFALGRFMGRERASDESAQAEFGLVLAAASTEKGRDWTRS